MADYGEKVADEAILATEKKLRETYATAEKELQKKLANFVARHQVKDAAKRKLLAQGKITKEEYDEWKRRQIFTKERWEAKAREVAHVMTDSNNQATKIINEGRLNVFAENHNFMAYIGEQQLGVSFDIYSTESVARLIQEDPQVLPEWKIDEPKDYAWNYKKVNNIIQQGIIQGESIPDMAKRLCRDLATQNNNKMNMFARTAITGAQNAGRQSQIEHAAAMGIEVKKQWIATLDSRTRDWHRDRDGETVPYNEKFSGGLEFPGDPTGKAGDVFNCRCTMVTVYPKYAHLSTDRTRLAYEEKDGKRKSYLTDSAEVFKGWSEKAYKRWSAGKQEQQKTQEKVQEKAREKQNNWEDLSYEEKRKAFDGGEELIAKEREEKAEIDQTLKELNHENSELRREKRSINRRLSELEGDTSKQANEERERLEKRLDVIEKRREQIPEEYSRTYDRTMVYSSSELAGRAEEAGVQYKLPDRNASRITTEEIIGKVAGGDKTEGSCASAAMCYVGQKEGYDVRDFRGGASRKMVSEDTRRILKSIGDETGHPAIEARFGRGSQQAIDLVAKCEPGKEYYLCAGRHASIVRKNTGGEFEYLELQSGGINGWKKAPIGADGKQDMAGLFGLRFGCDPNELDHPIMLETDGMYGSKLFHRVLGYINTSESEQMKGASGHER